MMNETNDNSPGEERSFQFDIRAMLVATAVLAAVLSLLKWTGFPTIALVLFTTAIGLELTLVTIVLLADTAWFRHKARRNHSRRDPDDTP